MEIKGIPLDAPLYSADSEEGIIYQGCEAVAATYLIDGDISDLLPAGLKPMAEPALGAVMIAHYPFSTVGQYHEQVSMIQVVDEEGTPGFFVPYIYVTNDAAMAAGRELVGAPKKMARIDLVKELDLVQATLERPTGKRLLTLTMKPAARMALDMFRTLMPKPTPMFSVRHLPQVGKGGEVTQLVRWWADMDLRTDARGEPAIFTGPASLTYDSPSVIDPVHRLAVGQMVAAIYLQFDMRLGATAVVDR